MLLDSVPSVFDDIVFSAVKAAEDGAGGHSLGRHKQQKRFRNVYPGSAAFYKSLWGQIESHKSKFVQYKCKTGRFTTKAARLFGLSVYKEARNALQKHIVDEKIGIPYTGQRLQFAVGRSAGG